MDNMNNIYTPSSSKITMTPEAIKKLVNNIVSVVLEGTTIVYPRKETSIPGKHNQESFMGYGPARFKAPERMTTPTINQGIRQGVIPNGNDQKRKLAEREAINPIYCNFANAQDCYRKHLGDRINYHHQQGCKQKINRNYLTMSPKQPNTGLFVGLNKGHIVTKKKLPQCPSDKKGALLGSSSILLFFSVNKSGRGTERKK
ncbi:60S ribosomal protein L36-3 [Artemisia annua]|uniref:60S ribosomal protein L36-3 n=1 Tax=Artemisia annua TaxID=35608 RepID=A0A2U1L8D2_ARTAN|nr:60S ribosomal protein L36-3 [Artemisia annua]